MGKPYEIDLLQVPNTLKWVSETDLSDNLINLVAHFLQYPLVAVGSGGSYSVAHFVSQVHERITGNLSKALTPLQFVTSNINPTSHGVLLLSAGGKNKDIIQTLNFAIGSGFAEIGIVCAKPDSQLVEISSKYPQVHIFTFTNPAEKDGFLAVNSLIATCSFMYRAYYGPIAQLNLPSKIQLVNTIIGPEIWGYAKGKLTIVAIGGGWAYPALIDLESKFTESGLANVLATDYRNFAHGRHFWLNMRAMSSVVVLLQTPKILELSEETTKLLPKEIPVVKLSTSIEGPLGSLDLIVKGFALLNRCADFDKSDPGNPDVPEYGRNIYNLGMASVEGINFRDNYSAWIKRKIDASGVPQDIVKRSLDKFLGRLETARFKNLLLDYDGTLVDVEGSNSSPSSALMREIIKLLNNGIKISIATGRGKSVIELLRAVIPEEFWRDIYVGCLTASTIITLDQDLTDFKFKVSNDILNLNKIISKNYLLNEMCDIRTSSSSISISPKIGVSFHKLQSYLFDFLLSYENVKILKSNASFNIVEKSTTKLDLLNHIEKDRHNSLTLVIGDQGQLGGNDYDLLRTPYGLSVNKLSASLQYCWNLSPVYTRGANGALSLLQSIFLDNGYFFIGIEELKNRGHYEK